MKILALDTSMTACSVALWHGGGVRVSRHKAMDRGQSEVIIGMIGAVMDESEHDFADLDLLAVTIGPGAFTGIRIGLATARGMALAGNLPCLGVTTLETVAHGLGKSECRTGTVLVVLDSKRDDVFAQAFDNRLDALGEARCLAVSGLAEMLPDEPVVVVGNASERAAESLGRSGFDASLGKAPGVPDAAVLASIAADRWHPGDETPLPGPFYLRAPDVSIPKNMVNQG